MRPSVMAYLREMPLLRCADYGCRVWCVTDMMPTLVLRSLHVKIEKIDRIAMHLGIS
jgi:hypothetical protein